MRYYYCRPWKAAVRTVSFRGNCARKTIRTTTTDVLDIPDATGE